jgi:two-component system sensor histidine kinase TctE
MPDESPAPADRTRPSPAAVRADAPSEPTDDSPIAADARRGWRPNIRALPFFARAGARRTAPEAEASSFPNVLRLPSEQRSLFGEILDWMLAPLLLLWPMSVTITYLVAQDIAGAPFDRQLSDSVEILSDHVKEFRGEARLQLPLPARELLRADTTDNLYFMVLGLRGEFVAGDRELPLPEEDDLPTPGVVKLRNGQVRGNEVRIAYSWVEFANRPGAQPALVQVAETLEKRSQLANEIIRGVIVPQFIVLPIAVVLVWFGLSRGLRPLVSLQAKIRARRPDDLSPIESTAAPDEVAPLMGAFNELLSRMEQNLVAQKRFMADAAHQMKTPLAGMRTQAELALRETDPQELRRSLRQIAASTERATHLINQLLSLARAEHQATDLAAFAVVDVAALAREQVQDWVPQALARGIDLGYEGPDQPLRIVGLPLLLRELLNNLLDNALRYTPAHQQPPASVTVRTHSAGSSVYLEVEDTGPGIPERERPLIFDRFYRVLGTNVDGSGLGLAIVREIVEQHEALLRVSFNPRATDPQHPGTLMSVEFVHTMNAPPNVELEA